MIAATLEVARHELVVAIKTRRAIAIAGLYLAFATLGGVAVILMVRFIEKKVIETLAQQGADPLTAAGSLSVMTDQAYQKLAAFFAGSDPEAVASSLQTSVILPFFLWGSLVFLPFLILFTSFDQISADLQSRSICYSVLRIQRRALLLGKVLAQMVIFLTVSAAGSIALALMAEIVLTTFSIVDSAPGLLRIWLLLTPFGLCYLAISAFCSASVRQPFSALLLAIGIVMGLRVIGWFRHIPETHAIGFLRHAEWLSPATYQDGLWLDGFQGPLGSSAAYLIFAALFLALADLRLRSRDL